MIGMAFWLVAGWACRTAATVQMLALCFLWWLNYAGSASLVGDIVEHLPMTALIAMVWLYGPGTCVWKKSRHASTWTRG
jgi:hypothetical protein